MKLSVWVRRTRYDQSVNMSAGQSRSLHTIALGQTGLAAYGIHLAMLEAIRYQEPVAIDILFDVHRDLGEVEVQVDVVVQGLEGLL